MSDLTVPQTRVLTHSLYSLTLGLVGGICLIYSALNEVSIWQVGRWTWSLPGDVSLWRALHVGPLLNGVMAITLMYISRSLQANTQQANRIAYALILMVWGNGLFYVFRIWGNTRGLAVESLQFGAGNIADYVAMLAASLAMVTTFYAVFFLTKLGRTKMRNIR